jgi:nucleoside triphosphatase
MIVVVDAIILNKDKEVLLAKNLKSLRGWILPGGKLEPGETLEAAITREIREELGLGIKVKKFVTAFVSSASLSGKTKENYVVIRFLASVKGGKKIKIRKDEIEDARWFEINRLPEGIYPDSKIGLKEILEGAGRRNK